jgi:hypothetical protein
MYEGSSGLGAPLCQRVKRSFSGKKGKLVLYQGIAYIRNGKVTN